MIKPHPNFFIVIALQVSLFLPSCDYPQQKVGSKEMETVNNEIQFDIDTYKTIIKKFFEEQKNKTTTTKQRIIYLDTLHHFYSNRNYEPVWTHTGIIFGGLHTIVDFLKRSDEHGLNPERYHYNELQRSITNHLDALSKSPGQEYESLAKIEIMLSDGLIRYAHDLHFGVVDPKQLYPDSYFLPVKNPNSFDLFHPLTVENISAYLTSIQPMNSRYVRLQQIMQLYKNFAGYDTQQTIPQTKNKIQLGNTTQLLSQIAERLLTINKIASFTHPAATIYPGLYFNILPSLKYYLINWDKVNAGIYDSSLFKLITQFQRENGLLDDGIIGNKTIDVLNTTSEDRIMQMRINLERYRWFDYPDSAQYLRVNIPEYYLYVIDTGRVKIKMKVCLGERFKGWWIHGHKPMNYETPLLHGQLSYLVLNPTWNVPSSIAVRETYYAALKDPTYLLRHNYRVYIKDSLVNPALIDWSMYNAEKLPFHFVQEAGRGNALGRIKFMFYNEFDVYLHDTPKRMPFNWAMRAVSHGCIRVEEPYRIVKYLLRGHASWDLGKIQVYLAQTRESRIVFLEKKIPIYLDYVTSWADEEGKIQFRDDVYGKDKILKNALMSRQ